MITLKTKYIILFWIIILILFTFYCVIRMGYIREKYDNILLQTSKPNIISYINNIQKQNDITDMPGCSGVYDDNFAVQALGYNTCHNAYSDYISKNLDVNATYGQTKTLSDICPVSAKSSKYSQCLKALINTFTDNSNILDNITTDMSTSINKRIADRGVAISGIETVLNPFMYSKSQVDFNNNMQMNGQVPKYQDDKLALINQYYQNRYRGGFEGFANIPSTLSTTQTADLLGTPVSPNISTLVLDKKLIKDFFGTYQVVKGQFTSLNNMTFTLGYDKSSSSIQSIDVNNIIEEISPAILLTFDNRSLKISYTVNYVENYNSLSNVIKLNLSDKNIVTDTNQYQQDQTTITQQLLSTLGINIPARLIMTYEDNTSPARVKRRTYKLVNDNLDTILILNKI